MLVGVAVLVAEARGRVRDDAGQLLEARADHLVGEMDAFHRRYRGLALYLARLSAEPLSASATPGSQDAIRDHHGGAGHQQSGDSLGDSGQSRRPGGRQHRSGGAGPRRRLPCLLQKSDGGRGVHHRHLLAAAGGRTTRDHRLRRPGPRHRRARSSAWRPCSCARTHSGNWCARATAARAKTASPWSTTATAFASRTAPVRTSASVPPEPCRSTNVRRWWPRNALAPARTSCCPSPVEQPVHFAAARRGRAGPRRTDHAHVGQRQRRLEPDAGPASASRFPGPCSWWCPRPRSTRRSNAGWAAAWRPAC